MRDFTVQVGTPTKATSEESAVRDEADRPVLRGAKAAGCDFLVTGDRDLFCLTFGARRRRACGVCQPVLDRLVVLVGVGLSLPSSPDRRRC